ncbi:MAG: ABC transporter permease [Treponema sp.]|jgi:lipoprotein-releasing system permease protein|nr:ABC transporter permease [Treponema sp.]
MKSRAGFFIALRYLWGRAHEGGRYLRGAAAGIAVSLIPIIATLIVADGMIRGITDRYLELGTGHLQVYNFFEQGNLEDAAGKIRELPGVRGAWVEKRGLGVLAGKGGKAGTTIRALDPSFWEDEGSGKYLVTLAGLSRPESDRDLLLGEELAASIGAAVGDLIGIMTVRAGGDGRTIPRMTPFTVRGIVSAGYHELDSLWCITTPGGGRRLFPQDASSSSLIVKIDDPYRGAEASAFSIYSLLGSGYGVYTWKELQRSQYSSYESTRQLLLFIMALVVLIAAVNVSSATSMLVIERQRDIAVLKAAGAGPGGISGIFLWGGFLTGLAGSVLGLILGLAIGNNINPIIRSLERVLSFFSRLFHGGEVTILDPGYYLETIPVIIDWSAVFLIGCFTILCSVTAAWIPARRAGKLKPLDLLRKY